jgi:hypothetical protein
MNNHEKRLGARQSPKCDNVGDGCFSSWPLGRSGVRPQKRILEDCILMGDSSGSGGLRSRDHRRVIGRRPYKLDALGSRRSRCVADHLVLQSRVSGVSQPDCLGNRCCRAMDLAAEVSMGIRRSGAAHTLRYSAPHDPFLSNAVPLAVPNSSARRNSLGVSADNAGELCTDRGDLHIHWNSNVSKAAEGSGSSGDLVIEQRGRVHVASQGCSGNLP